MKIPNEYTWKRQFINFQCLLILLINALLLFLSVDILHSQIQTWQVSKVEGRKAQLIFETLNILQDIMLKQFFPAPRKTLRLWQMKTNNAAVVDFLTQPIQGYELPLDASHHSSDRIVRLQKVMEMRKNSTASDVTDSCFAPSMLLKHTYRKLQPNFLRQCFLVVISFQSLQGGWGAARVAKFSGEVRWNRVASVWSNPLSLSCTLKCAGKIKKRTEHYLNALVLLFFKGQGFNRWLFLGLYWVLFYTFFVFLGPVSAGWLWSSTRGIMQWSEGSSPNK